jgi:hypothetical protein
MRVSINQPRVRYTLKPAPQVIVKLTRVEAPDVNTLAPRRRLAIVS